MLMPSQSPSSTNSTIQTLPSDQQQYIEKNSTIIKFRREKSMEFDPDTRFINHFNDDINNNNHHSNFESTDELIKLNSTNSSRSSSLDEEPQLLIQIPSSSTQISHPKLTQDMSNRRSTRRLMDETDLMSPKNSSEPDPNVFLISSETNSHNTIRKTKHDVKRFVMYIDEQFGETKPLHSLSAESLCRYLKHYFENTKKFDGTQYEPDTLRSFLLSIERYLKSKKYAYNLMESPLFQSCRQVIMSKRELWRKMGGGNHANNHHHHHHSSKPLTAPILNLQNLTVFDRTKPDGLLLEIYVHITKLCQEKSFAFAQLLWGDIALVDEQYLVYQRQKPENQTIRLYATPNQLNTCPVQAYRLYATHRPPQCNTSQTPFFLMPRASSIHHTWYKTTAAGKNLEQILQNAISKQLNSKVAEHVTSSSSTLVDSRISSTKRIHSSNSLIQPLNLSVTTSIEDDSGTASSSPINDLTTTTTMKTSLFLTDIFHKQSPTINTPVWDESVTDILLTVAKQRDTRVVKINILRTYLEEKLGVVEFLCLYRGFKSEPKLTFHGTPWEHYQRFLPVLFTLLALDNTTV